MPLMAQKPRARAGFTLLEVLIAGVLLTVALVGSLALSVGLLRGNQFNRERDGAYFLAQQQLDLLAVQPISQILANAVAFPNEAVGSTSSPATCYSLGQDDFIDSPIPCVPPPPAAYYVRTWVCCNSAGVGANIPAGTPCNGTGVDIISPDIANGGGVCFAQVEITWPSEPAGVSPVNPWAGGFADSVYTTVPPLTFTNHIYASMVREQ
jgi:type II secretory pathway pseudopilin PulG